MPAADASSVDLPESAWEALNSSKDVLRRLCSLECNSSSPLVLLKADSVLLDRMHLLTECLTRTIALLERFRTDNRGESLPVRGQLAEFRNLALEVSMRYRTAFNMLLVSTDVSRELHDLCIRAVLILDQFFSAVTTVANESQDRITHRDTRDFDVKEYVHWLLGWHKKPDVAVQQALDQMRSSAETALNQLAEVREEASGCRAAFIHRLVETEKQCNHYGGLTNQAGKDVMAAINGLWTERPHA